MAYLNFMESNLSEINRAAAAWEGEQLNELIAAIEELTLAAGETFERKVA